MEKERLDTATEDAAVSTAIESDLTDTIVKEKDLTLVAEDAKAYQYSIPDRTDVESTKVVIPIQGSDSTVNHVANERGTSVTFRQSEGRVAIARSGPDGGFSGLYHERPANPGERNRAMGLVRRSEKYRKKIAGTDSSYRARQNEASITVAEDERRASVAIPMDVRGADGSTNAPDAAYIAVIDLGDDEVETAAIGEEFAYCTVVCFVTDTDTLGACQDFCENCIGSQFDCVTCFKCLGLHGSFCAIECAGQLG